MLINNDPKIWGPIYWNTLYFVISTYPQNPSIDDKKNMYNFFMNFKNILPCESCRENFEDHLKYFPLDNNVLISNYHLTQWFINIQNQINKKIGKQEITIVDFNNKIKLLKSENNKNKSIFTSKFYNIVLLIALIIVLICYVKLK